MAQLHKKRKLPETIAEEVVDEAMKLEEKQHERGPMETDLDKLIVPFETDREEPVWKSPFYDEKLIPNPPFRVLLSGQGTSGKSTLIRHFLTRPQFYKDYFSHFVLVSPNCWNEEWEPVHNELGNKITGFDSFDTNTEAALMELYDIQRDLVDKMGKDFAPKILIIWDDIIDDRSALKSKFLNLASTRGRHQNFSNLFSSQVYNRFPLAYRKQLTNVFQFGTPNEQEVKYIMDELGHRKLTKPQFMHMFEECTKGNHKFMHINMQANPDQRYRRGFHHIFEIVGNPAQARPKETNVINYIDPPKP